MLTVKLLAMFLVFITALIAGGYPLIQKIRGSSLSEFPIGEALACGIFLGAGLIHMLGDASGDFTSLGFNYPLAFLLAGAVFLLLLLFEHIGREVYKHQSEKSLGFVYLTAIMLSIHSFLAGAALGLSDSYSIVTVILFAILAHKWAASFSLAIQINKSDVSVRAGILLFLVFAMMTPLGILFGASATHYMKSVPLLEPLFVSMAAGTFLYLGTLHGLKRAVMIEKCCDLKHFGFVVLGFSIMAVIAIWV